MERHSSKRKHHSQLYTNREFERYRPSATEKGITGDAKSGSIYHELSRDSLTKPPLRENADYVQRWLAQTTDEVERDTNRIRTQEMKTG
jgi:hypothetical protein